MLGPRHLREASMTQRRHFRQRRRWVALRWVAAAPDADATKYANATETPTTLCGWGCEDLPVLADHALPYGRRAPPASRACPMKKKNVPSLTKGVLGNRPNKSADPGISHRAAKR